MGGVVEKIGTSDILEIEQSRDKERVTWMQFYLPLGDGQTAPQRTSGGNTSCHQSSN